MEPRTEIIASQPSWVIESDEVRLALTQRGGHMAPVSFYKASADPIQPYYVSPWQGESGKIDTPVLVPIRGDFFCMPFGGDSTVKGVAFTTHGEPATETWRSSGLEQADGITRFTLSMPTRLLRGTVTKTITLVSGQNILYIRHLLEGYDTRAPLGHHATLQTGEEQDELLLSTSAMAFGRVSPRPPATFVNGGEYNALAAGAIFRSLERVPTIWKEMPFDSCSSFPRRRGFSDIIQLYNKPGRGPAWTAAVNPSRGWLWFTLKDPALLTSTLLWMENHGRHAAPWSGRNCCLGLEDVCGYFADGFAASIKKNELNEADVATAVKLSPTRPTAVNYIEGVTRVPKGFGRVKSARFEDGAVTFLSASGKTVKVSVDHRFVTTGEVAARR
jgi:hypothetical protein